MTSYEGGKTMGTKISSGLVKSRPPALRASTSPTAGSQAATPRQQAGFSTQSTFTASSTGDMGSSNVSTATQQAIIAQFTEDVEKATTREAALELAKQSLKSLNKHAAGADYAGKLSLSWWENGDKYKELSLPKLRKMLVGIVMYAPHKASARQAFFRQMLEEAQNAYKHSGG